MIKLLLLSLILNTLPNFLHASSVYIQKTHTNSQQLVEPDPNFGYKKVSDKSGYNFEDENGKRIFSKPVIDGYPLSKSYFAIVGKNKKYALVDKKEKYVTKFIFTQLYRINDDFFGIDKKDENEVIGKIINTKGAVVSEGGFVNIFKEDHDIYKVSLFDKKIKQERFGIIDKDFNYLVPPKCYHIRSKGNRTFFLLIGPRYERFYTNSLKNAKSYIRIDEELNVRASKDHINESNLSNFNKILKKYFASKKKYKLDELNYVLEINYGIQRNNQVELNRELTYNTFRTLGKMIINTSDEKTFEIPVYFSLNSPKEDLDSDFILGSKSSELDINNPAFFDHNFKEIASPNNKGIIVGFKNYIPQFIAIARPSTRLFDIQYLDKKRGQSATLISAFFGFDELENVNAYVDTESLAFLKKHDFKNMYADFSKEQLTFYKKDKPSIKYNGKLSHFKGGKYMSVETYEEVHISGYKQEIIINREGQVHPAFPANMECNLFEYKILDNGVLYPAKINGQVALLDKNFNNYLDGFKDMTFSILENGIGVTNSKSLVIGLKDFNGNWLIPSDPNNYISEHSPNIITVKNTLENEEEEATIQLLILKNGVWEKNEIKSFSKYSYYSKERKDDFLVLDTNDLMGLIDHEGNELLPIAFDRIMGHDLKIVEKKNKEGEKYSIVFDALNGYEKVFETPYQIRSLYFTDYYSFNEFDKREKGILSAKGEVILKTTYSYLSYLNKVDLLHFTNSKDKTNGLIDISGKILYEQAYASGSPKVISHNDKYYILFRAKDKIHVLNDQGKKLDTIENAKFGYGSHSGTVYFDLLTIDKKPIRYNLLTKEITKL